MMSLLVRLQANKTDKFSNYFAYFFLYMWAIQVEGLTPDYIIGLLEGIQAGYDLFSKVRRKKEV